MSGRAVTRVMFNGASLMARTMGRRSLHRVATRYATLLSRSNTHLNALTKRFLAAAAFPPHTKLSMPALSPTMKQGNIATWHKKVGDKIKAGDLLADVETDKATVAFEAVDEGYLAQILMPAGSKDVAVGTLVAVVVDDAKDVEAFKSYTGAEGSAPAAAAPAAPAAAPAAAAAAAPAPAAAAPAAAAGAAFPPHTKLSMPALSPTMKQGNIATWHKKEGDKIKAGDLLADVETDKATVAFEAVDEGYLAKILMPEGSKEVAVGTLVAVVVDEAKDVAAFKTYTGASASAPAAAPAAAAAAAPAAAAAAPAAAAPAASADGIKASPAAKKLAAERGVDLKAVTGTGPDHRIVKADVLEFAPAKAPAKASAPATAKAAAAAPVVSFKDIPVTNVRQVIAKRLAESKQTIPHFQVAVTANMDKLNKLRKELNTVKGMKLSVNDFIIKASALACAKVPAANSAWMGTFIRQYENIDVSVAVQTDTGLITPIVFAADKKGLATISQNVKDLAAKARVNKLQPQEFIGGTFTVSNLGMFGITQFNAIVNPPQVAILAVGTTESRVVADGKDKFKSVEVATFTLSSDHRVVDGAVAAQWMQAFKGFIENPITMML